ncbi:MAG: 2OG-Fe(II) oxygenase [Sphingomonas sp.]|nr:2OG-Fe(II) oxygenase [Sphingomonas sp.]
MSFTSCASVRTGCASHNVSTYAGPPFVVMNNAIPPELLARVDADEWHIPAPAPRVVIPNSVVFELLDDTVRQFEWGFPLKFALNTFLVRRRPGPLSGLPPHRDGENDPYRRRWVSLVGYCTDQASCQGGDLVITATGDHLRPARGDVALIRGDTVHSVEPITSGERLTLNVFLAEPRRPHYESPGRTIARDLDREAPG